MSETQELKRTPRYRFAAPAEVSPEETKAPFNVSVTELGLSACYVRTPAPFDLETRAAIKIFGPGNYFEATATVQHVDPGRGMALTFREIKPHFFGILRNWVFRAMRENSKSDN